MCTAGTVQGGVYTVCIDQGIHGGYRPGYTWWVYPRLPSQVGISQVTLSGRYPSLVGVPHWQVSLTGRYPSLLGPPHCWVLPLLGSPPLLGPPHCWVLPYVHHCWVLPYVHHCWVLLPTVGGPLPTVGGPPPYRG